MDHPGDHLEDQESGSDSEGEGMMVAYGQKVRLHAKYGNVMTLANTDSIATFIHRDDVYDRHGIIEAAGEQVKQEYHKERDADHVQQPLFTTAGNLPYESIFHVHVDTELPKFSDNIHKALKCAESRKMRSIAFPALECTPENQPYIERLLQALYDFEKEADPACLHLIDIICVNKEEEKYYDEQMLGRGERL